MNKKVKNKIVFFLILIVVLFLPLKIFAKEINIEEIPEITAPNVMLLQKDTGKILYEKNIDEKIYPASVTKLMTAILVMENCELDEIVTVSENAVKSVPTGYVNANLQVGEQLAVEDLMYAMLLPSANDAANALAEHVSGSIESFSTVMNTKARELGCTNTNFTNPSGLQEEEHYTTVRDLSLIAKEAFSNPTISKIVSTTNYTLLKTNKYEKNDRKFTTTNYMIRKDLKKYYCDYCVGGKTGYTGEAKNCVIEYANKDGIQLIAIVMGENSKIKGQKFIEAKKLFDYIYQNYENKNIANSKDIYEKIKIANGTKETRNLEVSFKDNIQILERKDVNIEDLEKQIEYTNKKAPIQKGEVIGNIEYVYDGIKYRTDLIANENVEESKVLRNITCILLVMLILYIIHCLKKSNKNELKNINKKYKKRKTKRIYY